MELGCSQSGILMALHGGIQSLFIRTLELTLSTEEEVVDQGEHQSDAFNGVLQVAQHPVLVQRQGN